MILGLCIPPIYLNNILAPILVAEKRQALWTIVMIGAAVLNPLINLALIPWTQARYHNGAIGAAISLVLTELAINGVGLILVGRHVFERRMLKRCALVFVASAAMVGVAHVLQPLGMAVSIIAGFTTFGLLVVCLRVIRTEELAMARVAIGRVRARIVRNRRVED
jgi:O-antigen/teichoic acid export membrane protein